jgi:hypothetical protein
VAENCAKQAMQVGGGTVKAAPTCGNGNAVWPLLSTGNKLARESEKIGSGNGRQRTRRGGHPGPDQDQLGTHMPLYRRYDPPERPADR